MKTLWFPLFALMGLFASPLVVRAQSDEHVRAEIVANVSAIKPGQKFMLGVRFKIDPGWHIYWTNPGDSGLPTEFKLKLPAGFKVGPVCYPVPTRLQLPGDIINYAYENEVMLLVKATAPRVLAEKSVTLSGKATWLVCKEDCEPGGASLSMELPVTSQITPDNVSLFKTWVDRLPIPLLDEPNLKGFETAIRPGTKPGEQIATLKVNWKQTPPADIQYLPAPVKGEEISDILVNSTDMATTITFKVKGGPFDARMPGLVTYTTPTGMRAGFESYDSGRSRNSETSPKYKH